MAFTPVIASDSLTLGARIIQNPTRLIRLVSNLSLGGAAAWSVFREQGGTAGYQVTAGKTFRCLGISWVVDTAVAGVRLGIGYADNDIGFNAVAGGTNQKYPGNSSTCSNFGLADAKGLYTKELNFDIPAGKYPNVANSAGAIGVTIMLWGEEV